jgi:hypothetical protein
MYNLFIYLNDNIIYLSNKYLIDFFNHWNIYLNILENRFIIGGQ